MQPAISGEEGGLFYLSQRGAVEPAEVGQVAFAASRYQGPHTAAPVSSPSSLIRTKLYRPRSGSDVIPRTRLLERLNAGLSGKATLVCAPAGKTTLVVQWLQTINRQVAWLSDIHSYLMAHGIEASPGA